MKKDKKTDHMQSKMQSAGLGRTITRKLAEKEKRVYDKRTKELFQELKNQKC